MRLLLRPFFLHRWIFISNWSTISFYSIWNACSLIRIIAKWHSSFLFFVNFRLLGLQMWIQYRIQIKPGLCIWPLVRQIGDAVRRRQSQGRYFRESLHQREWASDECFNWPIGSASRLKTTADNHTLGQDYLLCRSRILSSFSFLFLSLYTSFSYYDTIWQILKS